MSFHADTSVDWSERQLWVIQFIHITNPQWINRLRHMEWRQVKVRVGSISSLDLKQSHKWVPVILYLIWVQVTFMTCSQIQNKGLNLDTTNQKKSLELGPYWSPGTFFIFIFLALVNTHTHYATQVPTPYLPRVIQVRRKMHTKASMDWSS